MDGVLSHVESVQHGQAGEHPVGHRADLDPAEDERLQRRHVGEHPGGHLSQVIAAQVDRFQRRQAGEVVCPERCETDAFEEDYTPK